MTVNKHFQPCFYWLAETMLENLYQFTLILTCIFLLNHAAGQSETFFRVYCASSSRRWLYHRIQIPWNNNMWNSIRISLHIDQWSFIHITNRSQISTWWRHQMETFSALLALCEGDSPVIGEFPHRWIPLTKANDAKLWCFLWSAPEQTVEQTTQTPVIWDAIALIMTSL